MTVHSTRLFVAFIVSLGCASPLVLTAQSWKPPAESERCPAKWGATDQRGAANHMRPETVLRAMRLIQKGEVIELGHVLSGSLPGAEGDGARGFQLLTKPTFMNPQSNRRGSNEELVVTELGQVGTQLDGLAHVTIGDSLYNCNKLSDTATRTGFKKLGIENVGSLVTRGVLIDVARLKGVPLLPDTYEITVSDLQQALERQKLALHPGDAIIINTGWSTLWGKDNERMLKNQPGIGVAAAEWLARQDPMLLGADGSSGEVKPYPDPQLSVPTHQILLVINGIYVLERMKLDELSAKKVYEFALIVQPLKIAGGTGSTVAPIAIH